MTKFIKITMNGTAYVNVSKIEYVFRYCLSENRFETRVVLDGTYNNYSYLVAEETVEEIMEMINGD